MYDGLSLPTQFKSLFFLIQIFRLGATPYVRQVLQVWHLYICFKLLFRSLSLLLLCVLCPERFLGPPSGVNEAGLWYQRGLCYCLSVCSVLMLRIGLRLDDG